MRPGLDDNPVSGTDAEVDLAQGYPAAASFKNGHVSALWADDLEVGGSADRRRFANTDLTDEGYLVLAPKEQVR